MMGQSKQIETGNPPPRTLYLTEPGMAVRMSRGYFILRDRQKNRYKIGSARVDKFVIMKGVSISAGALADMMRMNYPLTYLGRNGSLLGRLNPAGSINADIKIAQYGLYRDDEARLLIARKLVRAKIQNTIRVVSRFKYNHREIRIDDKVRSLKKALKSLGSASSIEEVMGYEGISARYYFEAFRKMVPEEFAFNGRNRRPPKDPVNALLSFGYSMIGREMAGIIESEGLDPYIGFLHEIKPGRPSLALDLIEPLRPALIDRLVMRLLNKKIITAGDFREDARGGEMVLLNDNGRKKFYRRYDEWMTDCADNDLCDNFWFGRTALCDEVKNLKKAFMENTIDEWEPHSFK